MSDWETRSLKYVISAIDSAQSRQQKLWNDIMGARGKDGLIPIRWPLIEEFVESCRRTYSLMIDLETVASEYEAKISGQEKPASARAAAPRKAASGKTGKKTTARRRPKR
jgi:hypothetical protein